MALSGSVTTGGYTYSGVTRSVTFNWTATQNITNNKSTISWQLVGSGSTNGSLLVGELRVTVDGAEKYYRSTADRDYCSYGEIIASGSFDLSHANDGTRGFTVKVEAGIYNWAINKSGSSTFTLNTIPRASSITSANNITLGTACNIKWTPASTSFKYKLKFALGEFLYETLDYITPSSTSEYTYTGYIPLDADIAPCLSTSATTGTMTATLYTYDGNNSRIGSESTKAFTVTLSDSVKPVIKNVLIENVNENPTIIGWGNIAIAGYTKLRITAGGDGDAYGSEIVGFVISGMPSVEVNGNNLNYITSEIPYTGVQTYSICSKDSRGRLSAPVEIASSDFIGYTEPQIASFFAERVPGHMDNITVRANWGHADIGSNTSSCTLYYKQSSSSTWTLYGTIAVNTQTQLVDGNSPIIFEENHSYNFRIVVTDSLSSSAQAEVFVPTTEVTVDFRDGGKGVAIGKMSEVDGFEVAMPTYFIDDVYIGDTQNHDTLDNYICNRIDTKIAQHSVDGISERGYDGIWNWVKWNSGFADLWGTFAVENEPCTVAVGGWYRTQPLQIDDFPFEFINTEIPHVMMDYRGYSGKGGLVWSAGTSSANTHLRPEPVYIIRMSSGDTDGYINVRVTGKYE